MGYSLYLALIIALLSSSATPGTQPAATLRGLAGSPPLVMRPISQGPNLQAPEVSALTVTIGTATVYADTDEQIEIARSALAAMGSANLELPEVEVHLHSQRTGCSEDGSLSGYHAVVDGRHVVHSCGERATLLHELGHVWDDHQLDDPTRQLLLEHQELDSWHDEEWDRSGSEHLASIISWALDGTHPTLIGYYTRKHLGEAYRLVTGNAAPTLGGRAVTTKTNLTEAQGELVDRGVELLEAAGLRLPGIDIVGYDSVDNCHGRRGAAINHGLRTEVRLCVDGTGPTDDWVVIHELAHAWEHHTLTDQIRDEFLRVRGLDAWRGDEWNLSGAEHAAEIVVWGVIDREVQLVRIRPNTCDALLEGYVTLTGRAPTNGYAAECSDEA